MFMDKLALLLAIIGALNWGLIGLFRFDLVASICGEMSLLSRILSGLGGAAGVWCITLLFRGGGNDE